MIQKLCPKCRRVYIPVHVQMCPDCAERYPVFEKQFAKARNRKYDAEKRDERSTAFYHSSEWKALQAYKINRDCVCELCRSRPASMVHHVVPVREDWNRRLDINNLQSLCEACHWKIHHRKE